MAQSLAEEAVLLTSELVTNALVHGQHPRALDLTLDAEGLMIAVSDSSPSSPRVVAPGPGEPSGRGLALIEAVAKSWGSQNNGVGKQVWFRLAADA